MNDNRERLRGNAPPVLQATQDIIPDRAFFRQYMALTVVLAERRQ